MDTPSSPVEACFNETLQILFLASVCLIILSGATHSEFYPLKCWILLYFCKSWALLSVAFYDLLGRPKAVLSLEQVIAHFWVRPSWVLVLSVWWIMRFFQSGYWEKALSLTGARHSSFQSLWMILYPVWGNFRYMYWSVSLNIQEGSSANLQCIICIALLSLMVYLMNSN